MPRDAVSPLAASGDRPVPARHLGRLRLAAAVTDRPVQTLAQRFRDAVWEADPEQLSTTEAMILLA
ncbi:hypothetical protein ABZ814_05235, partial [Micromonospora musae]|uniref:hypothetical protein n=1 Tax=Micromonospora musae TaxID=1894970 RepID=UPI0033E3DDDC